MTQPNTTLHVFFGSLTGLSPFLRGGTKQNVSASMGVKPGQSRPLRRRQALSQLHTRRVLHVDAWVATPTERVADRW